MPKSIFISYVYEDRAWRDKVIQWANQRLLGSDVVTTTESEDVRLDGDNAIEKHLKPKIRGAAAVVCLVGQNTHNHDWVRYELKVATSLNKHVVLLRIPQTTGAAPMDYRHQEMHAFDPGKLRSLL